MGADHRQRPHHGKWLSRPPLALAEQRHHRLVARVTGEVKAAEALDRQDASRPQPPGGERDGVPGHLGAILLQPEPRPAVGAGDRLGVEAAVGGVVVFGRAGGAHRELRHRRPHSVVGKTAKDRETRPAMGAVGEGVAVATLCGVPDLGGTGGAGCSVGGDAGFGTCASRGGDFEALGPCHEGVSCTFNGIHPGKRWCLGGERRLECVQVAADGVYQNPLGVVQHFAPDAHPARQGPYERPESHTLHLAPDTDATTRHQCTVQTMQGSKLRTMCWTARGASSPLRTSAPTRAASTGPGVPPASLGEKFQVVGATI